MQIKISQGYEVCIDECDYETIKNYKWSAAVRKYTTYAVRSEKVNGKSVCHYMHRDIVNATRNELVDHKDGNGLNNTRDNLRKATPSQNNTNRRTGDNNTSGYKGVYFHKINKKYITQINISKKIYYKGSFDTPEEAYIKYCEEAKKYYGEFANI